MAKKFECYIKLQAAAGQATPAPPIGPTLGQKGVNIKEFCDQFNERTRGLAGVKPGTKLPVVISVFNDRSFTFVIKTVPATTLLKEAAGVAKGSPNPLQKVGKIKRSQMEQIAKYKMPDLTAASLNAAVKTLAGSARSMGIDMVEG